MASQVENMEWEIPSLYQKAIHQGGPMLPDISCVRSKRWILRGDNGREPNENRLNLDAHDTKATILKTKPEGQNALGGPPVYRSDLPGPSAIRFCLERC